MFTLKNAHLKLEIRAHGAELVRVLQDGVDYLWNGDSKFWGRTAPVLFPIVGAVAQGRYFYDEQSFELGQHGFARDMEFTCVYQSETKIRFELVSNEETRAKYPFDFKLCISYIVDEKTIVVKWEVTNESQRQMPFSIGAHPAFAAEPDLSDYYLQMKDSTGIESYVFDDDKGLVKEEKAIITEDSTLLPLGKDLFEAHPTLILENETGITLNSLTHDRRVEVTFTGFPYVAIWSPINKEGEIAPFICIEPWFGMADTHPEPSDIRNKKGIQILEPSEKFEASYQMTFN